MPIGGNAPIVDKLIKKTTGQTSSPIRNEVTVTKEKESTQSPAYQRPYAYRENATTNTIKMTFYVKQDFLDRLYNYAYWDRLTVTEAFNKALGDGLKDKNTSPIKK